MPARLTSRKQEAVEILPLKETFLISNIRGNYRLTSFGRGLLRLTILCPLSVDSLPWIRGYPAAIQIKRKVHLCRSRRISRAITRALLTSPTFRNDRGKKWCESRSIAMSSALIGICIRPIAVYKTERPPMGRSYRASRTRCKRCRASSRIHKRSGWPINIPSYILPTCFIEIFVENRKIIFTREIELW